MPNPYEFIGIGDMMVPERHSQDHHIAKPYELIGILHAPGAAPDSVYGYFPGPQNGRFGNTIVFAPSL